MDGDKNSTLEFDYKCQVGKVGMWSGCGQDVVRMWSGCGQDVVRMWSGCGQDVVRMWSGCGQEGEEEYLVLPGIHIVLSVGLPVIHI